MAFDPLQEDCHRLILETMRRNGVGLADSAYIGRLMAQYQDDPSELIVHDRDRSFHLVAKATALVDYQVPFVDDDALAERLSKQAEGMLNEAVQLDESNRDAQRMLRALTAESNDAYIEYLEQNLSTVEDELANAAATATGAYELEYAHDLGRRPYLRWMAALSSRQLISGRYAASLATAERSLLFDPSDPADVRFTALLALSKLECTPADIKQFRTRHGLSFRAEPGRRRTRASEAPADAWTLIAEMNAAYRAFDYDAATAALRTILRTYDHAPEALYFQTEFPDGVFGRVNVIPQSADELVLAISEATPLLQEGFGGPDSAGFSTWVAMHDLVQDGIDASMRQGRAVEQGKRTGGEN